MATINGSTNNSNWTYKLEANEIATSITNKTSTIQVDTYIGRASSRSYVGGAYTNKVTAANEEKSASSSIPANTYINGGEWYKLQTFTFTVSNTGTTSNPTKVPISSTLSSNIFTPSYSSAKGTITLSVLHQNPTLSLASVKEEKSNISDTLFIRWVSRKKFTVNYSFYDSATASDIKIYSKSGVEIDKLTTTLNASQGNFVISNFDIKDDDVTNGKTSFIIELIDSLGGKTRINTPEYNVTLYNNPNIIKTLSYVKRNGQTTKQAKITLTGTWYNGKVGTVDNSLTIKFDYWKTDASEPDFLSYRYTIPMQGTGNNISISNWILKNGNSILQVFDKENSYYVGVTVADGQTNLVQTFKFLLSKGEWIMAKFKDRVDFLKITIGGNPIVDSGSNTNGSWVKYYDGTMICTKIIENITNDISKAWGNLYESQAPIDLGSMPQSFTILNYIDASLTSDSWHCWIVRHANSTISNFGKLYLARPTTGSAIVNVNCIAIGKWK